MNWVWVIVIVLVLGAIFSGPGRCDVCGVQIKRRYYRWTIAGKKQKLCPKCNSQMERRVSKQAFKRRFGSD